jgi:hypothetical protein
MWAEPLGAVTEVAASHTVEVVVLEGGGRAVARVLCAHNAAAGHGVFGEMRIVDAEGAPGQRVRALVLLVREALRYAAEIGVTRVSTEAPDRLEAFASRLSGLAGERAGPGLLFRGELHLVRTAALGVSDSGGNLSPRRPADTEAADAAIHLSF